MIHIVGFQNPDANFSSKGVQKFNGRFCYQTGRECSEVVAGMRGKVGLTACLTSCLTGTSMDGLHRNMFNAFIQSIIGIYHLQCSVQVAFSKFNENVI